MCTVSFVPAKDGFFITSNRDEKSWRKQALPPAVYFHENAHVIYPKDAEAGGTWIAMKQNGDAAVLLNGAFEKHEAAPPYRKSRGVIFLEIVSDAQPVQKFKSLSLEGIEPFTLILFCNGNLQENRWNGTQKFSRKLDNNSPHIWSSATLYDSAVVRKREQWFAEWLNKNPHPSQENILEFHQFGGDGDAGNDLHMNRDGIMLTVSVTGISLQQDKSMMRYLDMKDTTVHEEQLLLQKQLITEE